MSCGKTKNHTRCVPWYDMTVCHMHKKAIVLKSVISTVCWSILVDFYTQTSALCLKFEINDVKYVTEYLKYTLIASNVVS